MGVVVDVKDGVGVTVEVLEMERLRLTLGLRDCVLDNDVEEVREMVGVSEGEVVSELDTDGDEVLDEVGEADTGDGVGDRVDVLEADAVTEVVLVAVDVTEILTLTLALRDGVEDRDVDPVELSDLEGDTDKLPGDCEAVGVLVGVTVIEALSLTEPVNDGDVEAAAVSEREDVEEARAEVD